MKEIDKGNYLKELRNKNNLTQKDLGDLIHYSDKNISKWEMGKSFPKDDKTLTALASALGVSKKDLITCGRKPVMDSKLVKLVVVIAVILVALTIGILYFHRTKVYIIKSDNKNIYVENGNYIINNDYISFSINYVDTNNTSEVDTIEIYKYKDDINKATLIHKTNLFPININSRRSKKSSINDLTNHIVVMKIKYKDNSVENIKLDFKMVKSKYTNEENGKSISTAETISTVDDYLRSVGFVEDSNSYIKRINDNINIEYNNSKYMKLEIRKDNHTKLYKLSLDINNLKYFEYENINKLKNEKDIDISKYSSIDCYSEKCSKEKDYIGYLIFLKNKLKTLEN